MAPSNLLDELSDRKFIMYSVQAVVIILFNGSLFAAICRYKRLRNAKEYIIIGGLALADTIAAAGALATRIYHVLRRTDNSLPWMPMLGDRPYPWTCGIQIHNILYFFGQPLSQMMLICVSLDRLLAVSIPFTYFRFDKTYGKIMAGGFYAYGCMVAVIYMCQDRSYFTMININIGGSFAWISEMHTPQISSMTSNVQTTSTCTTRRAIGNDLLWSYYLWSRQLSGIVSVLLYACVPLLYYLRVRRTADNHRNSVRKKQIQNLKKLVVTLGISSLATLVFYVGVNLLQVVIPGGYTTIDMPNWPIVEAILQEVRKNASFYQNLNPMIWDCPLVLLMRHEEIRAGIFGLVSGKRHLPDATTRLVNENKVTAVKGRTVRVAPMAQK